MHTQQGHQLILMNMRILMVLNIQTLNQLLRNNFSEASRSQQLPAQVGLRHLDWPQAAAGHIQVVGRPEDQNLWPQAKPQAASGLRTRRSSLRPQANMLLNTAAN